VDLNHDLAAEILPPLLEHPNANVRSAAVHGLLTVAGPRTVGHFVRASTDRDADVRNWATFGLRILLGEVDDANALDTEEIRNAIAERLGDEHDEIRAEAILGLAIRQDPRALAQLKHELRHWPEWDHCFEAAAHFRSPELYPLLQALLQQCPEDEGALAAAIEACRPSSPQ
jgi:HEAT repeat protein